MDLFFQFIIKRRELIISFFKLSYLGLFILTIVASILLYTENSLGFFLADLAKDVGELAIVVYILTIIPGIARRFRFTHKLFSLLMIFRRYIGLLMFFMILYHYMMMRGVATIKHHLFIVPGSTFELMGFTAFMGLLLLAITSNDSSTKKLGIWWGRIHALTYAVLWFIVLHTSLQEINIWSLLITSAGIVQVVSFIYKWRVSP